MTAALGMVVAAGLCGCGCGDEAAATKPGRASAPMPVGDEPSTFQALAAARPAYAGPADDFVRLARRYLADFPVGPHAKEAADMLDDGAALLFRSSFWARTSSPPDTDQEVLVRLNELLAEMSDRQARSEERQAREAGSPMARATPRSETVSGTTEPPATQRLAKRIRDSGTGLGISKEGWRDPWMRAACYASGRIPFPDPSLQLQFVANVSERVVDRENYGSNVRLVQQSYSIDLSVTASGQDAWRASYSAVDPPLPKAVQVAEGMRGTRILGYEPTARRQVFREAGTLLREHIGTPLAGSGVFRERGEDAIAGDFTNGNLERLAKTCAQALLDLRGRPIASRVGLVYSLGLTSASETGALWTEMAQILTATEPPPAQAR